MALARDQAFSAIERWLAQGKSSEAAQAIRGLVGGSGGDATTLNRLGDLLVKYRRPGEAISLFERAADELSAKGFFPKAIAVCRKVLRLEPDRLGALERIGTCFARQRLPAEARKYLLAAADRRLAAREFLRARANYETLLQVDPGDSGLRVRLAETLALEGKTDEAGYHLLELGANLSGDPAARESVFRRAAELLPGRPEPLAGLVGALVDAGKRAEAVTALEEAFARHGPLPTLTAELIGLYESSGRRAEALEMLGRLDILETPPSSLDRILAPFLSRGETDAVWERLRPRLTVPIASDQDLRRRVEVLDHLADLDVKGYPPALEVMAEVLQDHGDPETAARAVERCILALRAAGNDARARELTARLRALDPSSKLLGRIVQDPQPKADSGSAPMPDDAASDAGEPPVEAEAPAVPLTRADEEFVSGRVTQAEILEKYGLQAKAVQQLVDVVQRFPGHVDAQERLVRIREIEGPAEALRDARVGLALALRAAGRQDEARSVAQGAAAAAPLDAATRQTLEKLRLLTVPQRRAVPPASPERRFVRGVPVPAPEEVVVAFDDDSAPSEDPGDPLGSSESGPDPGTDLSELAAALEHELFAEDVDPILPEAAAEQSLEEVFAEFRRHVEAEVGSDDHRTHYDLGIAYKEMGLLAEAISEFEIALVAPDLVADAASMIALCLREQGRNSEAATWYRRALGSLPSEQEGRSSLEYDLAETLLDAGQREEALPLLRSVAGSDPEFRDVIERLAEVEASLSR